MKRYPALRPECILSWDYLQKVDAILKRRKADGVCLYRR